MQSSSITPPNNPTRGDVTALWICKQQKRLNNRMLFCPGLGLQAVVSMRAPIGSHKLHQFAVCC